METRGLQTRNRITDRAYIPLFCMLVSAVFLLNLTSSLQAKVHTALLTDPFLQLPTSDGIHVVWFTEWQGRKHWVTHGKDRKKYTTATTTKLSRLAEDTTLKIGPIARKIWRHEAYISGLQQGERVPYFVNSITEDNITHQSAEFTLQPLPLPDQPLKILLTSDHQLKPMTPANLAMVEKTSGRLDAVFFAGDLVNIPDRATEWFDDVHGLSFFPNLQGKGDSSYTGGEIIQHAPLFPVIGNHEVMGRLNSGTDLYSQFINPQPRDVAEKRYSTVASSVNPKKTPAKAEEWIRNNSFNTITYEELFTLPAQGPAGEQYYSIQFGDVYLIGLFATRIWRTPQTKGPGKYNESPSSLHKPEEWGHGEFIFADLSKGSKQYLWLEKQLNTKAFNKAKYKVVLMHQAPHGIGLNHIPVFAHPVPIYERDDKGHLKGIRYEYPLDQDILIKDIEPLFEKAGVHLVHSGHSHIWFRMEKEQVNYLETSNVGNSFGCYLDGYAHRENIPKEPNYNYSYYPTTGDPHGLLPINPTIFSPMQDANGNGLPCIASNSLTTFTILDTSDGSIKSYVYDMNSPDAAPQVFDEFIIGK